jgi:predicted enzyme related to lactoylglutathione lyase
MPRIVHFELPVEDHKTAAEFYGSVFSWQVQGVEDDEEGYWVLTTGSEEPGIDGALIGKRFATELVNIIGVDSVDDYLKRASEAGAEVVRPKREIPNIGFAAYIRDPEGNTVGLFEPLEGAST